MVVEFARNILKISEATSAEWSENGVKIIDMIEQFEKDGKIEKRSKTTELGGTMRLGSHKTTVRPKSLAHKIYGTESVSERHRHRYEVDATYREIFEQNGMIFSGISSDLLPEIVEVPTHRYFIGVQFHPEFKSKPDRPHPLFRDFITAALKMKK